MKKLKSSINHFTGREQQALHGICKQLKELLQPLLVLYLGSLATTTLRRNLSAVAKNATDFRLSCELLVLLPEGFPLLGDRAGLRALEQRLALHADVRLVLQTPEGLVRQLSSGRDAKINLHSQAIVLYERDGTLQRVVQQVADVTASAGTICGDDAYEDFPAPLRCVRNGSREARNDGFASSCLPALPVDLSAEEYADPLSVVVAFYRQYDLPEVRVRIGRWIQAVVSVPAWPVAETGLHLDFYVSVCRLLECAWLLQGYLTPEWVAQQPEDPGGTGMPPRSLYCPYEGADAWDYFPNHLSRAEFGAPWLVLVGLFAERSLTEWLSELYELFRLSLTNCTLAELGEERDLAGVITRLHRLTEVCHLLAVWECREGGRSPVAGGVSSGHSPKVRQAPVSSVL